MFSSIFLSLTYSEEKCLANHWWLIFFKNWYSTLCQPILSWQIYIACVSLPFPFFQQISLYSSYFTRIFKFQIALIFAPNLLLGLLYNSSQRAPTPLLLYIMFESIKFLWRYFLTLLSFLLRSYLIRLFTI